MNACPDERQLQRFLSGETPGPEDSSVSAHVETCVACQRRLGGGPPPPYLALEYVAGGSLLSRVPLAPAEAARVVLAVARAVAFTHRQGIVHRDLKAANVLLVSGGCEPPGNSSGEEPGGSHPP